MEEKIATPEEMERTMEIVETFNDLANRFDEGGDMEKVMIVDSCFTLLEATILSPIVLDLLMEAKGMLIEEDGE